MAACPLDSARPVELYDTTQIGPRGASRAPRCASRRSPRTSRTSAPPATSAPGRRLPHRPCATRWRGSRLAEGRRVHAPSPDATAQIRADGSTVDADAEAAAQAQNGLEYQALVGRSSRRAWRSSLTAIGLADEPLRRHSTSPARPLGRAPADGRHRREPRQRPDDPGRRRPAVPPQGGRPAAGRGRLRQCSPASPLGASRRRASTASGSPASSRTPCRAGRSTTGPPGRRRAGLRLRCRTSTRSPRWST